MILRCPLCLKQVTDSGEKLVRFCSRHPGQSVEVELSGPDHGALVCPECQDGDADSFLHGVFCRHVGCVAKNPYWKNTEKRVVVPQTVRFSLLGGAGNVENVDVRHWELSILRSIAESQDDNPILASSGEMWFPVALLWASRREVPQGKKAALVELSGPKSVGKTVLALMALDYEGYVGSPNQRDPLTRGVLTRLANLDHFVFEPSREGETSPDRWNELLYLRSLMEVNEQIPNWPAHTAVSIPGNIKAVYFGPPRKQQGANGFSTRTSETFVEQFLRALAQIARAIAEILTGGGNHDWRPRGSVVCFYDTAGEQSEDPGHPGLMRLDDKVDVVAVLVDAQDFTFAGGPRNHPSTIARAVQRLRAVRSREGLRTCVVITKTDTMFAPLGEKGTSTLTRLTVDRSAHEGGARGWLKYHLRRTQNDEEQALLQLLNQEEVDDVFLVWTVGIEPIAKVPHSFGIARFVAWCLELDVDADA